MAVQDLEKLVVQLSANIKQYENTLNKAMGVTNARARAIETRFAKMNKSISGGATAAALAAGKAFALIGGAAGAKSLIDSSIKIENALKVAGLSGEALSATYEKLFASAQKNGAPLESLVQLYSRVALVQNELGVSSEQVADLTDTVGKALRLTGADAQSASGALLQLAQSLGGGKVQAEEYNSLIDGMPGLLQAAAAGIKQAGGSVAELTKLVKAGKLSSKAFFDGIQAGSYVLDDKLAGATDTVDSKIIKLQNSLTKAAGEFNKSSHAANTFGGAIDNVSTYVDTLDMDNLAEELGQIIALLNRGAEAAQNLSAWIGRLSGLENIGANIVGALDTDGDGKLSAFGGLLTVESTLTGAEKLNRLTAERLSLEESIAALQKQPASGDTERSIAKAQARLDQVRAGLNANSGSAKVPTATPLNYGEFSKPPKAAGARFTPVDITDSKYTVPASGSGSRGGRAANDYQREIEQIKERTLALQAETDAQGALNGQLITFERIAA